MKGLKKLALATAVAAAPFAQAELTAMDDSFLEEMTGQAGVSIELSANVSIGSVEYTDTDGFGSSATAGTIGINNIVLGGNGGGALDDIKIDIDVDGNDGLLIHLGGTNVPGVVSGLAPVDFGLSVGSVAINGGNNLISNMSIGGNLCPIDVQIENDATINMDAYFEVTSGSLNVDVLGMGISNLTIGQDSRPFFQNQNGALVNAAYDGQTVEFAAQDQAQTAYDAEAVTAGYTDSADLEANGTPAEIAAAQGVRDAAYTGVIDAVETGIAGGVGAPNSLSNMAYVGMTIQTTDTTYDAGAGSVAITQALDISVDAMSMDISMNVSIGGNGIGSVAVNDLDLSGTTLKIYGH